MVLLFLGGWLVWNEKPVPDQDHPDVPPGETMAGEILWHRPLPRNPRGILVLASGYNDRRGWMVRHPPWVEFARRENLALAEASFASPREELRPGKRGYYYPEHGSGQRLQDALEREYGPPETCPPLLLFGFSGGGIFLARFQDWTQYPVAAWSTLGSARYLPPRPGQPPALLVCGDMDGNLEANRRYLQECRRLGVEVQLQELFECGHVLDFRAEEAVQLFFHRILQESERPGPP
ncbi:MAG: hypothetical protein ACI4SG_00505 [Oligosphaeraceae bacterium]